MPKVHHSCVVCFYLSWQTDAAVRRRCPYREHESRLHLGWINFAMHVSTSRRQTYLSRTFMRNVLPKFTSPPRPKASVPEVVWVQAGNPASSVVHIPPNLFSMHHAQDAFNAQGGSLKVWQLSSSDTERTNLQPSIPLWITSNLLAPSLGKARPAETIGGSLGGPRAPLRSYPSPVQGLHSMPCPPTVRLTRPPLKPVPIFDVDSTTKSKKMTTVCTGCRRTTPC